MRLHERQRMTIPALTSLGSMIISMTEKTAMRVRVWQKNGLGLRINS